MPELGDVEGFRRVALAVEGSRIRDVIVLDPTVVRHGAPAELPRALRGARIGSAERAGKWLVIGTSGPWLLLHFGMTGSLRRCAGRDQPDRHDRLVIETDRGGLCFRDMRRFGGVQLAVDRSEVDAVLGRLGPDALGLTAATLRAHLATARGSTKAALMDQARVAGIGNMLSDEILWRARLHPATPVRVLDAAAWSALYRAVRAVTHAVARAGHTPRGARWLSSARDDPVGACPRCGALLERSTISGRTAVWCPRCQPTSATRAG